MAYISENTHSFGASVVATLSNTANAVATFLSDLSHATSRSALIQELQAMDDATLMAKHGISRGEIVSYVFADKFGF